MATKRKPKRLHKPRGRPTKYKPEYARVAYDLALVGYSDKKIAESLGVEQPTIAEWRGKHPEFSKALFDAREGAQSKVGKSLFQRAVGYKVKTVKIFQHQGEPVIVPYTEKYAPDVQAAIFYLTNRMRQEWISSHRQEQTGKDGGPVEIKQTLDLSALSPEELAQLEAMAKKIAGKV